MEERTGCFTKFIFMVSRACRVAFSCGAMGLSAVCDCGISWSYSLFYYRMSYNFFIKGENTTTLRLEMVSFNFKGQKIPLRLIRHTIRSNIQMEI